MKYDLKRSITRKATSFAIAAGLTVAAIGGVAAEELIVGDQGFEDHVIDDPSGYAYGAAGQPGDPDGWSNPSSSSGLSSPWLSLDNNGVGIGGDNASFMYTAAYAAATTGYPAPIGNQAIEVQSLISQSLMFSFEANTDYEFTVSAGNAGDPTLQLHMYDATTLSAPMTKEDIATSASTISSTVFDVANDEFEDFTFLFTASSIADAGLVGQSIGIAIGDSNLESQGVGIDNVRLNTTTAIPEPGSLGLIGLATLGLFSRRRRN